MADSNLEKKEEAQAISLRGLTVDLLEFRKRKMGAILPGPAWANLAKRGVIKKVLGLSPPTNAVLLFRQKNPFIIKKL